MATLNVEYTIDQQAMQAEIDEVIAREQGIFNGPLREPLRQATRAVIYGNFMGTGRYGPRPIGKFTGRRARYQRGWIEQNYKSQRAYMAGAKKRGTDDQKEKFKNLDHLRSASVLDAVSQLGSKNPAYAKIAGEAKTAQQSGRNPLDAKSGGGFDNLRGFLGSDAGKSLTRQSERQNPSVTPAAKMRYGVQTGKLARAWYDLNVSSSRSTGLTFQLNPALGSTSRTPAAQALTNRMSRNRGWKGLMDHAQLVRALEDQGLIVLK